MTFPLSALLYGVHVADRDTITVIDVGCSHGGLGSEWNIFGQRLKGLGLDPLISEIGRLRAVETRNAIAYEAAFVGSPSQPAEVKSYGNSHPIARSSGIRAAMLQNFDHQKEVFNAGAIVRYSDKHVSIDQLCSERNLSPDVLKIDTDGAEVAVLHGASEALRRSIIEVHVECMFQGSSDPWANTLSRIDGFLRELGFQIYSMEPFRYSRAALPGPFVYDMFAATHTGQLVWADVVFLRDLASPDCEGQFGFEITPERIIKTACLMELLGLQDCAAELLQARANLLMYPIDPLLDLLVPPYLGRQLSYRDYIVKFEKDPAALFPSRLGTVWMPVPPPEIRWLTTVDLKGFRTEPEWHASLRPLPGETEIETSAQAWAYAATISFEAQGASAVEVEVVVLQGCVGLTLFGPTLWEIREQAVVEVEQFSTRVVILQLRDPSEVQGLLIRNGPNAAASIARITAVRLLRRER